MAKIEITLCMGSSCFARGNNRVLAGLETMIRRNGWTDAVSLAGSRCSNRCGSGPNLTVDGEPRSAADIDAIETLIAGKLELRGDAV